MPQVPAAKNAFNNANILLRVHINMILSIVCFYFEGFTSIPTALTANDRNRRIQVYQASDG